MTPDLMQEGAQRLTDYQARQQALVATESGGRSASMAR